METQGLVLAPKDVVAEARDVFSRIGANVEMATFDTWRNRSRKSYCFFVVYVRDQLPKDQFSAVLRKIKHVPNHRLLFYVPHHEMDVAFNIGMTVGREMDQSAEIASDIREVKQLLKSWDAVFTDPPPTREGRDLVEVRNRLGLTQEQMASALNVTTRTLQNWERNIGTSQMARRTRDLWEAVSLMDDYVVAREERDWLNTPNPAFENRKPIDLIVEGKLRDLSVEFQRLREGQPL